MHQSSHVQCYTCVKPPLHKTHKHNKSDLAKIKCYKFRDHFFTLATSCTFTVSIA